MSDWSSVALAGITAGAGVVGGFLGYLGARLQAWVGVHQADSETVRQRAAQLEDHLQQRKSAYHDFLDADDQYLALMSRTEPFDREHWEEWLSGYHHTLNGVILFGTEDVSDAAGDLNSTYHEVYVAHVRVAGDDPFWKKLQRAHLQHRDEYIEHKSRLIEKMREDVAPTVPLRDD